MNSIGKHLFSITLLDGFGEGISEVLPHVGFEVVSDPEQLLLLDSG